MVPIVCTEQCLQYLCQATMYSVHGVLSTASLEKVLSVNSCPCINQLNIDIKMCILDPKQYQP